MIIRAPEQNTTVAFVELDIGNTFVFKGCANINEFYMKVSSDSYVRISGDMISKYIRVLNMESKNLIPVKVTVTIEYDNREF